MSAPTITDPAPPPDDPDSHQQRVPPHSTAAERSLLGAWLISAAARQHRPQPDDWYHPTSQHIAAAITTLHDAGQPIDQITVADQLERDGNLARIGGPATLDSLIAQLPATDGAPRYAQIIRRDAHARRLLRACRDLTDAIYTLDDQETTDATWRLLHVIAEEDSP